MGYELIDLDRAAIEAGHAATPTASWPGGVRAVVRQGDVAVGSALAGPGGSAGAAAPTGAGGRTTSADLAAAVRWRTGADLPPPVADGAPAIAVVVCTRDRAERLRRCLGSLLVAVDAAGAEVRAELLVVDNASRDGATAAVAEGLGVRVVREPVGGLDVARARGVAETSADVVAFVDDDVVVDATWLRQLARTVHHHPAATAVTGGVLAYRLDTGAQIWFESMGGFLIGWTAGTRTAGTSPDFPFCSSMGVGCNMAFRREAFAAGLAFDPALDTGRPLPGGGDLDALVQAARTGAVVYEPSVLAYHEHRTTWKDLRYQYYTWGKSWAVVLRKWHRQSPGDRPTVRAAGRRAVRGYVRDVIKGPTRHGHRRGHAALMLVGFGAGLAGSYGRSQRRMRAREREVLSAGAGRTGAVAGRAAAATGAGTRPPSPSS